MSPRGVALHDDRGQVGGMEALPFGLLIFVIGSLLVTNAWAVVDARVAVDAAAREAVRAYVEAPDAATGDDAARRAAEVAIEGHRRRADRLRITVVLDGGRPFARCVPVTIEARYPVPAIRLPFVGGYGHPFDVRSHHTERIDPYRAGLLGDAAC